MSPCPPVSGRRSGLIVAVTLLSCLTAAARPVVTSEQVASLPALAGSEGDSTTVPAPTADPPGGLYDVATLTVALAASTPGDTIRYTLDGGTPTEASAVYTAPLQLGQTAVVRARAFRASALPSATVTHTYVLDERLRLPVVALTTDPENLWDTHTGIYVMGPNADPEYPHAGANFWQDWEIPVHFAFFEPSTPGGGFSQDAGARIYGAWSRAKPQKSLALFARRRYGPSAFTYPLFPDKSLDTYESFVLRNGGNDWEYTLFRDALMQYLIRDAGVDMLAYRPVVLFLNGQYWGIHNLREKISEHYIATNHGVDPDRIDLLELVSHEMQYRVLHGSDAAFRTLLAYVEGHDMTSDADYAYVDSLVDLNNFIDYEVAQIFYANTDWPGNNVKLWRSHDPGSRWRWILYDTDFGFALYTGAYGYRHETLPFATAPNGPSWPNPPHSTLLLRRLLLGERFRHAFINRFADHLNTTFDPRRVLPVIDAMASAIGPDMVRHQQRWGGTISTWRRHVDALRDFAQRRPAFMWLHLRAFFDLEMQTPVTVDATPPASGVVRVNRVDVDGFPWTGPYFPGVPIALTAIPRPGYRFTGWTGTVTTDAPAIVVDPSDAPTLKAHFAPDALRPPIVVNEIFYHPPPDADSEDWIEVTNTGTAPVDLGGWTLRDDDDTHAFVVPAGTVVPAGGYAVLCRDPEAFQAVHSGGPDCVGPWTFGLSSGGDAVRLFDGGGVLVDSVMFDDEAPWPTLPDGDGFSLELTDPALDNTRPSAWRGSTTPGGTPGAGNTVAVGTTPGEPVAGELAILPNHPNPFVGTTVVTFILPRAGHVALCLYDVLGRRVANLVDGHRAPGVHSLAWDGAALTPGVYFLRLTFDNRQVRTRPVLVVR